MTDLRWANHKNSQYRPQGTISSATAQKDLRMLRAALNSAYDEKIIPRKPTFKVKFASSAPKDRWLSKSEVKRLVEACYPEQALAADGSVIFRNRDRSHIAGFIMISIATAARKQAVLELTWDQIYMPSAEDLKGLPLFDLQTQKVNGNCIIDFGEGNGNKRRPKMNLSHNYPLVSWLAFTRPDETDDSYSKEGLGRVITFRGEPVKDIKTALANVAKEAGVPDVTPHTLKHTSITWMVQSGLDLLEISKLTNTSIETLEQHYTHHRPDVAATIGNSLAVW